MKITSRRNAFTLVELVVVVLILGILAGIAAPKVFNFSKVAAESSIRQSLGVIRDAIDMYKIQNGTWPGEDGTQGDFKNDIHPFLSTGRFPAGPIGPAKGDNRVRVLEDGDPLSGGGSPARAWKYDNETGQFIFNWNEVSSDGVTAYDQF